jgi:hypothetical protein
VAASVLVSVPGSAATTRVSLASWIVCIAAGLLAAPPLFAIPLNSDVAWVLFVGRRLLAGARPYVDIIDYQAPLVFVLGLPVDLV